MNTKISVCLLAALSLCGVSFAEPVVTNLTAQSWKSEFSRAMGKFGQARNQKDRKVYLDALDTVLYIATNCPGMDDTGKKKALADCGYDIAIAMGRDGYATGWREKQRLDLLKNTSEFSDKPARRFQGAFAYAKEWALICPDEEFPKAEKALKDLFLDPAYDARTKLQTLASIPQERLPVVIDVLDTGAKIVEKSEDPAVRSAYYTSMVDYMCFMYGGWEWGHEKPGAESLNPKYSYEAQLEMIEKGLADDLVDSKADLAYRKGWTLAKLERFDEAAQAYLGQTTNTDLKERANAFVNYARFLESRANRYYTGKWQPYLRQAEAAYLQALALGTQPRTPSNWNFRESGANCAIEAGDFGIARVFLDDIVKNSKGHTNDFVQVRLGRIAWAEKDYEGVIRHMPPVDSPLSIRDRYTIADRALVAKSYKLLGREEEELAALKILSEKADRNWKSYYNFAYERLKAKLGKE